jgi:DegV family protein with EDD domain
MAVTIFADAVSNLFPSIIKEKKLNVKVLKVHLRIEDDQYDLYDEDFDLSKFNEIYYSAIKENKNIATSLISPGEYEAAFKEEINKGNKVICFTMASGISGTYQSACLARDMINEEYKEKKVEIIDSMTAGLGEGLQVIRADALVKEGKSFEEIVEDAEKFKHFVRSDFTVDQIKYLIKTGRASKALAKFVSLLNIKILLKRSDECKIAFAGTSFGRMNSIKQLSKVVLSKINKSKKQIVYITHCNILSDANKLKDLLIKGGIKNIEIYDYDYISASHIGPGSLAVFYEAKERS